MVKKVYVAQPRGFCAGVEMAIKALSFLVQAFEAPIYCYHEIVHNQIVVDRFSKQGVIFVDSVGEVPEGAMVMLSAHGSAPDVVLESGQNNRISVNAVCPLVTKVHHEAKTRTKKGYEVLYIGHEGHDEAIGTLAVAPNKIHLVTSEQDLDEVSKNIAPNTPVALLAQTTLAMSEWHDIATKAKHRFPQIWTAAKSDLCFATTNRQTALKKLVEVSDVLLIIGSSNSSNTLALEKVAKEAGCQRAYRIDSAQSLKDIEMSQNDIVGITAGASAPEDVVLEVVDACNSATGVEFLSVVEEEEYFPPPSQLRNLVLDINYAVDNIFSQRHENLKIKEARSNSAHVEVFSSDRARSASDSLNPL